MSAIEKNTNQLKKPALVTSRIDLIQIQLNELVDKFYIEASSNLELKENLNLSQLGLTEPSKVDNFLNNTPQGKMIIALIGEEEALEEELLEQKYEHNIEQQQIEDAYNQFILYEAALIIKALKEHVIENEHLADFHSTQLDSSDKSASHEQITLNTTVIELDETLDNLIDAKNYHAYLTHKKFNLKNNDSEINKILSFHQLDKELINTKKLLSQENSENSENSENLSIKTSILKIKLNKKRLQIQNEISNPNRKFSEKELLTASHLLLEHSLLLTTDNIKDIQQQLNNATDIDGINECLLALKKLELLTNNDLFKYETAIQSISKDINNAKGFIQLQKLKKNLKSQFAPRVLLDNQGTILESEKDIDLAFYTKPNNINTFFDGHTLYFIDKKLFEDHILTHNSLPYLVCNNIRIEQHEGIIYLLKPEQKFAQLSSEEKITATKEANKAKILALNAKELAQQYKIFYQDNQIELTDIEKRLSNSKEKQNVLKFKLKQKRQHIEKYTHQLRNKVLTHNAPSLNPSPPKFIPKNKDEMRLEIKKLTEDLQKDFKIENRYDNQTMHQINQRVITSLQHIPPETLSLVLTKYRGVLPVVSHLEQNSLNKAPETNYSPLELAKQQVELKRMFNDINISLQAQTSAKLAPEMQAKPSYALADEFNPRATPVMAG